MWTPVVTGGDLSSCLQNTITYHLMTRIEIYDPDGRRRFIAPMTLDTKNINFVIVSNISYGHCWIDHPRVDNMKVWHVFFYSPPPSLSLYNVCVDV